MQPFPVPYAGRAVPLRRSNVDTDAIIPSVFLKRVTRTGYADALFAEWRADPGFVLNSPDYAGAGVLVAGHDFGIGSSREHAVWALQDSGFRVVIASGFGDIFRGNALKGGLLTVQLPHEGVEALWAAIEADPGVPVEIDLPPGRVRCQHVDTGFELDDYSRWRLLEGLDDIGLTLRHQDAIADYERTRARELPVTTVGALP